MLLAQDGKVSIDQPITRYLADAPPAWEKITVRHLLTHTSGIPEFDDANQGLDPRREYTEDELVKLAAGLPPKFAPGARWSYSGTGYVLLGVLIHRVSGKPYGDFLRERVFSPLHMGSTRVLSDTDLLAFRASGYELEEGLLKNQDWASSSVCGTADGGLVSSVMDMAKWDAAIQSGALLPPAAWQAVFTPVTLNSGKTFPVRLRLVHPRAGTGAAVLRTQRPFAGLRLAHPALSPRAGFGDRAGQPRAGRPVGDRARRCQPLPARSQTAGGPPHRGPEPGA